MAQKQKKDELAEAEAEVIVPEGEDPTSLLVDEAESGEDDGPFPDSTDTEEVQEPDLDWTHGPDWVVHDACAGTGCEDCRFGGLVPPT